MSKIYVILQLVNLDGNLKIAAYHSEDECVAEVAKQNLEYHNAKKKELKNLGYYSDKEIDEYLSYASDVYYYEEVELK